MKRKLAAAILSVACLLSLGAQDKPAATSPKGTFNIQSEIKSDAEGGETVFDFVVSTSNPDARELLHQHADITGADYYISPDENWIYDAARYGHRMCGGQLFKRTNGLKFEPVLSEFDDAVWRFFAKQEGLTPDKVPYFDSREGIIDFVAWSPDCGRLLLDLRGGDFGGERTRGVYKWYLYFNTSTQSFEVTDYLRRLNKDAWKRYKNFEQLKTTFPEAVSAEPVGDLPPPAELKKRYEDADRRLNASYQQISAKIDKQRQTALRSDQRQWIKTRDAGAKFYREAGGKSTPEQRYWQYMLDSTEAQAHHLEAEWKSEIAPE